MKHTLVAKVADQPGVLNRVASLFRRRAFNIDSLTVGHTETPEFSRMTIVVDTARVPASIVAANLRKLIPVAEVVDVTHLPTVDRDLALIRVKSSPAGFAELASLVEIFRARIVDVATDSVIVEVTGPEAKVASLVELLRPRGILEMVRTGKVAMVRGSVGETKPAATRSAGGLRERRQMAKMYYDSDADLGLLSGRKVAVIGYGSQGHAHALNLKDSGVDVVVGLPAGSRSRAKAQADGLTVKTPAEAAAEADVVMILTPDTGQAKLFRDDIAPGLKPGNTLMFAHGFNIRFGTIQRARGRRRLDDRAQGPRPPGARGLQGGPGHAGPPRRAPGRERARRRPWRSPTRRASAAPAPGSSRRPSPRRRRPTSSASRPCSAAAPPRS